MNKVMLGVLMGAFLVVSAGARAQLSSNSYDLISPPEPIHDKGKVSVVEVFWYGCPHCYAFEPYLDKWLKTKPSYVKFSRLPGVLAESWVPHARAFYAAKQLGVLKKIHQPLFDAIHKYRQPIFDEAQLRKFFVSQGVNGDAFTRAYNSNDVEVRVKEAMEKERRWRITGVPTIIIGGKYRTSAVQAGSFEGLIKVINELVEKVHKERQKT
jgi:thiol:disulfide interchange protein DsbA